MAPWRPTCRGGPAAHLADVALDEPPRPAGYQPDVLRRSALQRRGASARLTARARIGTTRPRSPGRSYSPVSPSTASRRRSACPLWRGGVSLIFWREHINVGGE